jgi:hypothetical protein
MPFQLPPTTVPTFPEKPPKIHFLIVPILIRNYLLKNMFSLGLGIALMAPLKTPPKFTEMLPVDKNQYLCA